MPKRRVLVVYGTRPEAIKMAPVIAALRASEHLHPFVAVTGQHRAMLDQVNELFGITPDHDLDIIAPRQQLHDITDAGARRARTRDPLCRARFSHGAGGYDYILRGSPGRVSTNRCRWRTSRPVCERETGTTPSPRR